MSKKTTNEKINRNFFPSLLAVKYLDDYQVASAEFPNNKKVEFVEHVLGCLDIMETYLSDPTVENWKIIADKEYLFLKKHGKRLGIYKQQRMDIYFDKSIVLVQKGMLSVEEFNSSGEEQELSEKEMTAFIRFCRNGLHQERDSLLLKQIPEDESDGEKFGDTMFGTKHNLGGNRAKIKRKVHDNLTRLSQEQSALLLFYLTKERVFLKDEYLNHTDAGIAFEILTGFSKNTFRVALGKIELYQNKKNLTELHNLFNRLIIDVGKDLKPKKKIDLPLHEGS